MTDAETVGSVDPPAQTFTVTTPATTGSVTVVDQSGSVTVVDHSITTLRCGGI